MRKLGEKNYGFQAKFACMTIAVLMYLTSMTTPALGSIAQAFPDVNPDVIKQISSLPSLMLILFANAPGILERFMRKKTILNIAMVLAFVGVLPSFFGDFTFILVTRVIFGAGYGIIFAYASSMIAYLFVGKRRDAIMGYKSAVGAAAGVVFQTLGGVLATINWRYAFLGFLLIIPAFIIIHFMLPEPEKKVVEKVAGANKSKLTPKTFGITIYALLISICMFSFMTTVPIVFMAGKYGSPAVIGVIFNVFTAVAFVAGMIYGRVIKRILKKFTLPVAIALFAVCFVILISAGSISVFYAAAIVFGLAFGTYNPEMTLTVIGSSPVPPSVSMGIYLAGTGFGQFLSPVLLTPVAKVFGIEGLRAGWYVAAGILGISAIATFIVMALSKTNKSSDIKTNKT